MFGFVVFVSMISMINMKKAHVTSPIIFCLKPAMFFSSISKRRKNRYVIAAIMPRIIHVMFIGDV